MTQQTSSIDSTTEINIDSTTETNNFRYDQLTIAISLKSSKYSVFKEVHLP